MFKNNKKGNENKNEHEISVLYYERQAFHLAQGCKLEIMLIFTFPFSTKQDDASFF